MRCPRCGSQTESEYCPRCGSKMPADKPLEPELIDDGRLRDGRSPSSPGGQGFFRVYRFDGQSPSQLSCLPAFITLLLSGIMASRYGFLEAFCFLIFTGIGKAVSFFIFVRRLFFGRPIDPRILTVAVWIVSWLLVVLLRGGR